MRTTGFLVQLHPDCDPEAVRAALAMIRGVAQVEDQAAATGHPTESDRLFRSLEEIMALERAERGLDDDPCVL